MRTILTSQAKTIPQTMIVSIASAFDSKAIAGMEIRARVGIFGSHLNLSIPALHCDPGRPARRDWEAGTVFIRSDCWHHNAGETPAVPVKGSNDKAKVTNKGKPGSS